MRAKVSCHEGRCFESESDKTRFDSLFDDSNIVDRIRHDLYDNIFR